jgi:hypothetical protein
MGPIIAQATGSGDFWKVLEHLGLLAAIVGNISMAIALRKRKETRRIEPQPFDVRVIDSMAREKDCLSRHDEIQREIVGMRNRRDQDMKDASLSRKAVYEQINKVRGELSDKIDTMPDRIIATLRNFGVIGKE